MGKTHKKTHRRQESIKRARHRDRRTKIGAIVLCAAIIITTFLACGMQLLVPVTEAAVSADNKTRSGNVDVQKNNNSLTASKMDSGKKQNSSEADVNAAEQSSEPDKETKLDEILHSAKYPGQLKELAKKNDEAIDFIYEYPKEHSKEHDIDLTAEPRRIQYLFCSSGIRDGAMKSTVAIILRRVDVVRLHFRWLYYI